MGRRDRGGTFPATVLSGSGVGLVICTVPSLSVNRSIFPAVAQEAQISNPKVNMKIFTQDILPRSLDQHPPYRLWIVGLVAQFFPETGQSVRQPCLGLSLD